MFGDFLTLTMDQLVNQAAKIHYMSGGKLKVPLVSARRSARRAARPRSTARACTPGSATSRASRSRCPSTPYDAKGLLKAAIRDDNPVVFFEDKMMYAIKGPVPEEEYTIPLGVADVKRAGDGHHDRRDELAWCYVALEAAELLAADGHQRRGRRPAHDSSRSTRETLVASAQKTGRAIVVDEGHQQLRRRRPSSPR